LENRPRFDAVYAITFRSPAAVYPAKQPVPYPAAAGEPGAPFKDPNFKLAVLSELIDAKVIDLGSPRDLAAHVLGRPVDLEAAGYEPIPAAYDYLVRYPLTPEQLAGVASLTFDGGSTIYPYVFFHWDGETAEFDIASLEGIGHCPNLTEFLVIAMTAKLDLRPLLTLPRLKKVGLAHSGAEAGADAASNEAVKDVLRQRGVTVN